MAFEVTARIEDDRFLSSKEICQILGISRGKHDRMLANGELNFYFKIGATRYVRASVFHEWLMRRERMAAYFQDRRNEARDAAEGAA